MSYVNEISKQRNILVLPKYPVFYDRKLSSLPLSFDISYTVFYDLFINIVGFVPFGFFLTRRLSQQVRINPYSVTIVVTICFGVSLFIEFAQSWMPGRDSSLLDLLLNTLGALIGVIFFILFRSF